MARYSWLKRLIWLRGSPAGGSSASYEKTVGPAPIISISDAKAKPAKSLIVGMEPVQDLHGYDSPWPAGGGKNLWNPQPYTGLNYNIDVGSSVTLTESTGVTVNGNKLSFSVPVGWDYKDFKTKPLAAGTYRIHFSNSLESGFRGTWYVVGDTGAGDVVKQKETYSSIAGDRDKNVTVEANDYIVLQVASTNVTTIELVDWQIESGSSYTSWSPYENLCPITGRTGVTVCRTGKNLIPFDDVLSDGWTNTIDGVTASYQNGVMHISGAHTKSGWTNIVNISQWTTNPIRLPSGITVRTPLNPSYTTSITMYSWIDGVARNLTNNSVIDAGSIATVHGFYIAVQGEHTFDFDVPMIVTCGDERPTAYEPYVGASFPVVFPDGQTVYGGTVDLVSGVLTVTHEHYKVTGSEIGVDSLNGQNGYRFGFRLPTRFKKPTTNDERLDVLCNIGTANLLTLNSTAFMPGFCLEYNIGGYSVFMYVLPPEYNTSQLAFEYLTENGCEIVAALAEPQTYQLTPQQIQMLKGANTLWSDAGDLTLTYLGTTPANLLGGMLGGGFGGGYNPPAEQDPEELTEPEATEIDEPAEETPAEEGENNGEEN